MKFIKKIIKSDNFWPLVVIVFAFLLSSRTLIFQKGYFNMHDDLQMMRQLEMEKCFLDLQIPCRWIADMGYGFGFPLFNFYPPLPYLMGELFRLVGFTFVTTAKLTFALSFLLSGVGMYFLAKKFFGKTGGVVSSVFYIWAPYHAVDVYVRGAMNESWALIFFPLIFLYSYQLITESNKSKDKFKNVLGLTLSWFGLFTSHNLMVLIFAPFFALWCLIWLVKEKNYKIIPQLAISGIWSLGLAAFFTIPAIVENKYTWLKSQLIGYYDYTAHFVTLKQLLISRFWDYGPSVWLEYDRMSFQIGHLHWILSLIILAWVVKKIWNLKHKNKGKINFKIVFTDKILILLIFLLFMGWSSAFMTHVRSTPIYQTFSFLALVQFPWRFLTLITFSFSFLAGGVVLMIKNKKRKVLVSIMLCLFLVIFNWKYFLPEHGKMGALTDEEKFSNAAWDLQQTAGIYDYLPMWAKEAPKGPQKTLAEIMQGEGLITNESQGTNWAKFNLKTEENLIVRINIFKFSGWKVYLDGNEIEYSVPDEEKWGRMWINVSPGEHLIEAKFTNTPIRTISNGVSLLSFLGLLFSPYLFRKYIKKSK